MSKLLSQERDENERLKTAQKQTQRTLDEITLKSADFEHQLTITKSDLTITTEKLNSIVDESQLQVRVLNNLRTSQKKKLQFFFRNFYFEFEKKNYFEFLKKNLNPFR